MNQNNTKAMNNKFFLVIIPLIITACNGSKENTEKSGTASYSINSAIVDVSEVVGVELFAGRLSQGLDADIRFVGSDSVVARGKGMIATAYRFIRYDKVKSIGVIIGIVVSIFLIGQQIGVLSFLTGLMGDLVSNSRQEIGQILVVDNITRNANELPKLNESLVRELRSIEGVMNTNLSLNQDRFDKGQINACDLITDEIDFQKELTRFNEKRAELVYKQIELINNSGALSSFIDNLR